MILLHTLNITFHSVYNIYSSVLIIILLVIVIMNHIYKTSRGEDVKWVEVWEGDAGAPSVLRHPADCGSPRSGGTDKQRLILPDRQRRTAPVWQVSWSFTNASATWRQNSPCLSIKAICLNTDRHLLSLSEWKCSVEFCSAIQTFCSSSSFCSPRTPYDI